MARPKCPKCGSRDNVPILYGLPIGEAFEQEKAGKIKLGGCLVSPEDPNRYCRNCGNEWEHATCLSCIHLQGHMTCTAFPDGIPEKIFFEGEECPHFEEGEPRPEPKKAAKGEPKPEPKKAAKKLIRFQLPANPTAAEIDKFTEWIKGQDEARRASNAKPTEKKD